MCHRVTKFFWASKKEAKLCQFNKHMLLFADFYDLSDFTEAEPATGL